MISLLSFWEMLPCRDSVSACLVSKRQSHGCGNRSGGWKISSNGRSYLTAAGHKR